MPGRNHPFYTIESDPLIFQIFLYNYRISRYDSMGKYPQAGKILQRLIMQMEALGDILQMSNDSAQNAGVSFTSLRLRPGTILHIQNDAIGAPLTEIHFLGSIADKIIMVTQKIDSNNKTLLSMGNDYILHGFSGQYDFSFTTQVTGLHQAPFPYATLAYPTSVHAKLVRKLARVKTALPASVTSLSADTVADVTLADLTVAGALMDSVSAIGRVDEMVHIAFTVDLGNERKELAVLARVRHVHPTASGSYHIGVEFKDLSQNDKLALHYIVHEWAEKTET